MRRFVLFAGVLLPLAGLAFVPFFAPILAQSPDDKITDRVIYVPTPQAVVEKMLEMVKVGPDDIVFDLGCGDGRIICTAAKKHGSRGVGIDIDPARIRDSRTKRENLGLTEEQVEIRQGDALKVKDLDKATVIAFYMLPEFMEKLEPQVKKLRPGTRLVAHDYPFPNLTPDQVVDIDSLERASPHTIFVWTIKEAKPGAKKN